MNKNPLVLSRFLFICFMALGAVPAMAGGGGSKGPAEGVNYIAVSPPLIVNYGGPGKVRFIKAELSLRAENAADATEIMHHLPLIRDKLISILSAQTEEVISTPEGKESLRVYALAEINKALHQVEHGAEESHAAEDEPADKAKHDKHEEKSKKGDKAKDKPSAKDHATEKDKKAAAKKEEKSSDHAEDEHEESSGPASDLLFNNFVVQK